MGKTLRKNISANFMMRGMGYLFSLLTFAYAARVLQPSAYGEVSFSASIAGYFILLSNLGLPIYAVRRCAESGKDRAELSRVFHELLSVNILLSAFSILVFLCAIALVPRFRENSALLLIFGCGIILQTIGCEWLFRGLEEFRFLAVSMFCVKAISLVCLFLFVRSEKDVLLFAFFSLLSSYGSSLICCFRIRRTVCFPFRFSINREHFRPLIVFSLMTFAVSIYSSLDISMLGFMQGNYETGLYALAAKGKSVLTAVSGVFWSSMLPRAAALWKNGERANFKRLAQKSIAVVTIIQLFVTAACLLFAKQILLLVGGEAYLGAVSAFRILILALIPIGFSNILGGQVLIPAGQEKKLLYAELVGAAVNFFANLFFIPLYSINGAAATTLASEIIVWLLCVYFIKKELGMDFGFEAVRKLSALFCRTCRGIVLRADDRMEGAKLPYYCPCCNLRIRSFVNGGYDQAPQIYDTRRYRHMDQRVICPLCGSLPRHRILVSWMQAHTDEIRRDRILHFAQERSLRMWMGRNGVSCITADLHNPADLTINIEDTGLESDSFDLIICNHVLEHVSDYKKALRELRRIIRPGKAIILSFPVDLSCGEVMEDPSITDEAGRVLAFGQNDHLRVFGRNSRSMLEGFGFDVEEIRGEDCDPRIKPVIGPADYDYNVLYLLRRREDGSCS